MKDLVDTYKYINLTKEERWELEKDYLFKNRYKDYFDAIGEDDNDYDEEFEDNDEDYLDDGYIEE